MQFSNFSRTTSDNIILFKNLAPIENVKSIKYYTDNSVGNFSKKEIRWSFDNNYWSSWSTLTQNTISSISVLGKPIYLEVRYTLSSLNSGTVTTFSINYLETAILTTITPQPKPVTIETPEEPVSVTPLSYTGPLTYSNFIISTLGLQILFQSRGPLLYVNKLLNYIDNRTGQFSKVEFRWSFNKTYWSSWETLNVSNLNEITNFPNLQTYLEIRYILSSLDSGEVSSFSVTYSQYSESSYPEKINTLDIISTIDISQDTKSGIELPIYKIYDVTNADKLDGQHGDYYLWRSNHKGEQSISTITDLQKTLTNLSYAVQDVDITGALNVDGPGVGVYYGLESKNLYFKSLVPGNKMFITEDLEGHITFDVNDASINELYDLVGVINGINIGGGDGEVYKQTISGEFQFRTISAGNANVIVTTVDDRILISLDASISGEAIWSDPIAVSTSVGGISGSGQDGIYAPVGDNAIEILETLLYEFYPPRILDLDTSSQYLEKWQTIYDVSIFGSFDNKNFLKGQIYESELFIDGSSNVSYPPIYYPAVSTGEFGWNITGPSDYSDKIYNVRINNKLGLTDMPSSEASVGVYYVNPYYYGIVNDTVNAGNITEDIIKNLDSLILPMQTNIIDYDISVGFLKLKFVYAYDKIYGNLSSIFDLDNDFNVTSSFDQIEIDLSIGSSISPISYNVYIKNHWIAFPSNNSNFKLEFKT